MLMSRRFHALASVLFTLLIFAIPIEHKYDKWFRFYSLKLIPSDVSLPSWFDVKIYLYLSDVVALFLFIASCYLFKEPLKKRFSQGSLWLWILFAASFFSLLLSSLSHYPLLYIRLLQLLTPVCLFSFVATSLTTSQAKRWTDLFCVALFSAGTLQAFVAITQYFTQSPCGLRLFSECYQTSCSIAHSDPSLWTLNTLFPTSRTLTSITRSFGTLPHPNVLGGFLTLSLLSSFALLQKMKRPLFLAPLFLLQCFALATTYSRSALYALILGSLFFFCLHLYHRKTQKQRLSIILATLGISLITTFALLGPQWDSRGGITGYTEQAKQSDAGRLYFQSLALKMIQKHPFFGVGYQQMSYRMPEHIPEDLPKDTFIAGTHNIYLFLAAETGLISLFAFLALLFSILYRSIQAPLSPETSALCSTVIALCAIGACDFYPILFQQGKLLLFSSLALLAALNPKRSLSLKKEGIWSVFDQISPTYDRVNRILSFGQDLRWRRALCTYLPPQKNLTILDLATGTADQLIAFFEKAPSIKQATGVDLSEKMLQIGRQKLKKKSYEAQITLQKADALNLPFKDTSYDVVSASFGLRNFTDTPKALQEMYRLLKPKGKVLILECSMPKNPIRPFYLFYLRNCLPFLGGLFSKEPGAYRYLNETIEGFTTPQNLLPLFEKAGFQKVQVHPFNFGTITLYEGEKP